MAVLSRMEGATSCPANSEPVRRSRDRVDQPLWPNHSKVESANQAARDREGAAIVGLAGSDHCQPAWTIVAARVDFTSVNHELGLPVAAVAQVYTSRRPTKTPLEHRYIFFINF